MEFWSKRVLFAWTPFPADVEACYNRVFISILKFDTHLVVGSAVSAGDVAVSHSLAAVASKITYTLAEFSNQEFHDVHNVFNA